MIQKTDSIEIVAGWIISYFALDDSNAPIGPIQNFCYTASGSGAKKFYEKPLHRILILKNQLINLVPLQKISAKNIIK